MPHWVIKSDEPVRRWTVDECKAERTGIDYYIAKYAAIREAGERIPEEEADVAIYAFDTVREKHHADTKEYYDWGYISKESYLE